MYNYQQTDSQWRDISYPSKLHPKATVGTSACGVFSVVNALANMFNIAFTKSDVYNFINKAKKCGARENEGTNVLKLLYALRAENKFSFLCDYHTSDYIKNIDNCLIQNGCVILSSAGGLTYPISAFSTGGHFVVIIGKTKNNYIVSDSYFYNTKLKFVGRQGKIKRYKNCYLIPKNDCVNANIQYILCLKYRNKIVSYTPFFINSALNNKAFSSPKLDNQIGSFSKNQKVYLKRVWYRNKEEIVEVVLRKNGKSHFCNSGLLSKHKQPINNVKNATLCQLYSNPKKVGVGIADIIIKRETPLILLSKDCYFYNEISISKVKYENKTYFCSTKVLERRQNN